MLMEETQALISRYQNSTNRQEREDVVRIIYRKYIDLVFEALNHFKKRLAEEKLQDMAQDAFIAIVKKLDSFEWTAEKAFRVYVYRTAYNMACKASTRTVRLNSLDENIEDSETEIDPEEEEAKSHFLNIWYEFDAEGYEINFLFHAAQKTDREIANLLESTPEAVRKRRTRAKEKFCAFVKKHYGITSLDQWIENYEELKITKKDQSS